MADQDEHTSVSTESLTGTREAALPAADALALYSIGLSSWLLVSGVFAAAVWHIDTAPEGFALFAHLDVAVQAPNIIPAFLVLSSPSAFVVRKSETMSGAILALGIMGAAWLTGASNLRTSTSSIGLLLGAAIGGTVGSSSMVIFFPLAAASR